MPEYDGKVHIFTGVYWGFLVAYLGGYSTFLAGTVWFLIVTYYTQPTYQTIMNAIASTFYERVIASSLEKIIDELASSGVTDFITGVVLFGITALKSILGAPKTGNPQSRASIFRPDNNSSPRSAAPTSESVDLGLELPVTPTSETHVGSMKEVGLLTPPALPISSPMPVPVLRPPKIRIVSSK